MAIPLSVESENGVETDEFELVYFVGEDFEILPFDVLPILAVAFPNDVCQLDRVEIVPEGLRVQLYPTDLLVDVVLREAVSEKMVPDLAGLDLVVKVETAALVSFELFDVFLEIFEGLLISVQQAKRHDLVPPYFIIPTIPGTAKYLDCSLRCTSSRFRIGCTCVSD